MINLRQDGGPAMSKPRGRRTQQVAVYLSPAEAAAWDQLRDIQRGAGYVGSYPPGRGAWIAERVQDELIKLSHSAEAFHAARADRALDALVQEEHRLGQPDWERAHGRIRRLGPR